MQFNFKSYKIMKVKHYVQKEKIYIYFNGVNKNSNAWITIGQNLKIVNFKFYKISNQTSNSILSNSVYKNLKWIVNSVTLLATFQSKKLSKQILLTNFESTLFNMLAIKINDKVYQTFQLKKNYSLNYEKSAKLIFQFQTVNIKKLK